MKRIGIDARFYGPIGKGLGRYTQEVVDNIIKINTGTVNTDLEFVVFLSPHNYDEFVVENVENVRKVVLDIPWYSWREQILMPFFIWREKINLMHYPHFNIPIFCPTKFVFTLHDLILTHFPTMRATTKNAFIYHFKNFAYKIVTNVAVRMAQKIITVSEFTKRDIISKFQISEKKIIVTYEGVANLAQGRDSLFIAKLDSRETLDHYHIGEKFILYVGNAYPHKNLETLVKVFSRLHVLKPDFKLVLVGRSDYFYERIHKYAAYLNLWQKENVNSPVIFADYVPDAQLEIMYQEAMLYVFPSLYEGFGLPPLEAMGKGCPVVSSDRASLPEVLGEAALYFNPENEDDILNKISTILDDVELRERMKTKGLEQVKKFNWWECANKTLEVYRSVLVKK